MSSEPTINTVTTKITPMNMVVSGIVSSEKNCSVFCLGFLNRNITMFSSPACYLILINKSLDYLPGSRSRWYFGIDGTLTGTIP